MGMTITEKILAAHAGLERVEPGQLINARVDIALGNDITAPIAIKEFNKAGATKVFDRDKVVLVPDHSRRTRTSSPQSSARCSGSLPGNRTLTHYYETGGDGCRTCPVA